MKKSKKASELKVVVMNPPTNEQMKLIIKKISKNISNLYSQKLDFIEEFK